MTGTQSTVESTSRREDALLAPAVGRVVLVVCALVAAASLAGVLIVYPGGTATSADPGAPTVPVWATVLPPLVGIALALLLPPRRAPRPAAVVDRSSRLASTTIGLLLLAAAFPLIVGLVPVEGEDYVLLKLALFIVVPAVLVLVVRRSIRLSRPRVAWRWWAPLIVVAVWTVLSQLGPWNPPTDFSGIDPASLAIAATATAVTAGFGEEFFYRRLLQSRLEAALGPWPGIALTALAFALMHLGSHGTGEPLADIARVVVAQGSFGLFVGVLWWRYRSFWAIVLAHLIVNGWPVLAAFVLGRV